MLMNCEHNWFIFPINQSLFSIHNTFKLLNNSVKVSFRNNKLLMNVIKTQIYGVLPTAKPLV